MGIGGYFAGSKAAVAGIEPFMLVFCHDSDRMERYDHHMCFQDMLPE